jgi:Na+-transporting NADH:ubiquinone oxidoreductase subunit NqrF
MKKEIDGLSSINADNLRVNYIVTKGENEWSGLTGHLNRQHFENYLPTPSPDTLILFSGTKSFNKMILKVLEELGYTEDMLIKF